MEYQCKKLASQMNFRKFNYDCIIKEQERIENQIKRIAKGQTKRKLEKELKELQALAVHIDTERHYIYKEYLNKLGADFKTFK